LANTSANTAAEPTRRDFLFIATGAVGVVGAASLVWPFVQTMAPDAATVAAGAPIEVDLAPIAPGQIVKVFWRGKLIFVRHRPDEEIKAAQDANIARSATLSPIPPASKRARLSGWSCTAAAPI
jgi:ubiquinol-cytochrome c reductase iron-sulfur subunit